MALVQEERGTITRYLLTIVLHVNSMKFEGKKCGAKVGSYHERIFIFSVIVTKMPSHAQPLFCKYGGGVSAGEMITCAGSLAMVVIYFTSYSTNSSRKGNRGRLGY